MSNPIIDLRRRRSAPLVRQVEAAECGLACVAMIAGYHGYKTSLADLRQRFAVSLRGAKVVDVIHWAAALKLGSRAVRCEPNALCRLALPAILHWRFDHFVVLDRVRKEGLAISDPASGQRIVAWTEVDEAFTGVAIELLPTPDFVPQRAVPGLNAFDLIRPGAEDVRLGLQLLLVTLAGQLAALVLPLFSQTAIDQVVVRGDHDFLLTLLLGFMAVQLFEALCSRFRTVLQQALTNVLGFSIQTALLHHLLRLPLDYFQRRPVGEVLMRFQSINTIRQTIVGGGIGFLSDLLLTIVPAAILMVYEPLLGGASLCLLLLAVSIKLSFLNVSRRLTGDLVTLQGREQTLFLENIRGISSIKASAVEEVREGQWRNVLADVTNAQVRLGRVDATSSALIRFVTGAGDLLIVYWACKGVMSANWTIGMMVAFLAYRSQVMQHGLGLVDFALQSKLLDVHVNRVADIALNEREIPSHLTEGAPGPISKLALRAVDFRYSLHDPFVLADINFSIARGEIVAIVGPSGCGKSTMLSIAAGLRFPTSGELLVDGRSVTRGRLAALRRGIGTVLQDDKLFMGSIAENIALFDDALDMGRVIEVARLACIHEEIVAMPMQYRTAVGDMGLALSGGQRQRIMIARALYRRPWLLLLDEGTAQIDLERERAIVMGVRRLGIACLVISHRPQTAAYADRIVRMSAGRLVEEGNAT